MRIAPAFLLIGVISAVNGGCASTKLTLSLDIYKEDPASQIPLDSAKALSLYTGLDEASMEAEGLANDRSLLAQDLFDTYESLYAAVTKATTGRDYNSADLSALRLHLQNYKTLLNERANEIRALTSQARAQLNKYMQLQVKKSGEASVGKDIAEAQVLQLAIFDKVNEVSQSLLMLSGPLGTDFEKTLSDQWSIVVTSASEPNLGTLKPEAPELKNVRSKVAQLTKRIEELRKQGRRISTKVDSDLRGVLAARDQPAGLEKAKGVLSISRPPESVGLGDRGAAAINDLTTSTGFNIQVDRQDPADPVWRTISAPENESKWNRQFSKTYFYAEGNSSVVVVRDTPMHFRIHQGNNNPSALIQGQLQISRAVADAAISIAGAAAGIPAPQTSTSTDANTPKSEGGDTTQGEALSRRKATVEQDANLRAQAVRSLRSNLITTRQGLVASNGGDISTLRSSLSALLGGYGPVFAPTTKPAGNQ